MNFDILSFIFGKLNCGSNFNDVVSYLLGKAVSAVWKTITNVAIASFTAVSPTLRELVVDITPVQSGSGAPSPTNVRPISGWTAANVRRSAINIWDEKTKAGYYGVGSGSYNTANDQICSDYIPVAPSTQYRFAGGVSGSYICTYDKNKTKVRTITNHTFTTRASEVYITISFTSEYGTTYKHDSSINYPDSDTGYHAYAGTVYPISWQTEADTVYGGTLTDNGNGTWTLTELFEKVTLTTGNWIKDTTRNRFYKSIPHGKDATLIPRSISNCFSYSPSSTSGAENIFTPGASADTVWFVLPADSEISSVVAWENWITSNPVDVVLPLSTPQTYTLTAESVHALIGQNNIFADCGNINTITYRES